MPTLIITVDLECCRCSNKIQKILCYIKEQGEFVIEKIVYEKDKVFVSGPFDANKLYCKLWCMAGRIIKNIEVEKPPPSKPKEDPKPKPKPEPPTCKIVYPYPWPYPCPQPAWPCSCPPPYCQCHTKPQAPAPPPPPPPPPPPEAPKQRACQCPNWPSCHCYGCTPSPCLPPPMPPYRYPMVVCDENPPDGACTIM